MPDNDALGAPRRIRLQFLVIQAFIDALIATHPDKHALISAFDQLVVRALDLTLHREIGDEVIDELEKMLGAARDRLNEAVVIDPWAPK